LGLKQENAEFRIGFLKRCAKPQASLGAKARIEVHQFLGKEGGISPGQQNGKTLKDAWH